MSDDRNCTLDKVLCDWCDVRRMAFCGTAPHILAVLGYDGRLQIHKIELDSKETVTAADVTSSAIDMTIQFTSVGAVAYSATKQLLIVAGGQAASSSGVALQVLRPIDTAPYFAVVASNASDANLGHDAGTDTTIFDMHISPDDGHAALLNCCGDICIVQIPSLQVVHTFPANVLAESGLGKAAATAGTSGDYIGATSVRWWSQTSIVVTLVSGETRILHLPDLVNRLDKPIASSIGGGATTTTCVFTDRSIGMPAFYILHSEAADQSDSPNNGSDQEAGLAGAFRRFSFYCTGMDRFYPLSGLTLPPTAYHVSRFQSISPQALYRRKLQENDYDAAVELAEKYGLDTDVMLRKRWEEEPMTGYSVQTFLAQIKDHSYALAEIRTKRAPKADTAQALYELGLQITAPHRPEPGSSWDLECLPMFELRRHCLVALDRLKSYEVICSCRQAAFDPAEFSDFAQGSVLSMAVTLAQEAMFDALRIFVARHSDQLQEHLFAVLFMIPETSLPSDFSSFLPKYAQEPDGSVRVSDATKHSGGAADGWRTEVDWVEAPAILDALPQTAADDLAKKELANDLEARGFEDVRGMKLSAAADVTQWCRFRAMAVERCGWIDLAHRTLAEGIGRGVIGLDDLLSDLQVHTLAFGTNRCRQCNERLQAGPLVKI